MKNTVFIMLYTILILLTSCDEKKSNYTLDWQDYNLCVIMPHPTMGVVTPGLIDWKGVELSEVIEDICNEFRKTNLSGSVSVWVRFEKPEHDKYGNETMSYDDHFLTTIPISEGKKFKSGDYLDLEYHLKDLIKLSAFPINEYSPIYNNSFVRPVAPTDTLTNIFD